MACERYDSCETVMGKEGLTGLSHGMFIKLLDPGFNGRPTRICGLFGKDIFRAKRTFLLMFFVDVDIGIGAIGPVR
jgi:hypothetical protein